MENEIIELLSEYIPNLDKETCKSMIERPKHLSLGDFAFPCFSLAKVYRKDPKIIAEEIVNDINKHLDSETFEKVEFKNGYINFYLNKINLSSRVIKDIIDNNRNYGNMDFGKSQVITMDISSPNIAKPFSMGHLRSTVIGMSMSKIAEKVGFNVVKINHLGDWGTQFGKLIVAYRLWGDKQKLHENPIMHLFKLYTKFHELAEKDNQLDEMAREEFKRMEDGEENAINLWKEFKNYSLESFNDIYNRLKISFDSYNGEAFYNDKMGRVIQELKDKDLLVEEQGAMVVKLENMPPALIQKKNGSTLYLTRDLATAIYRKEEYNFYQSYYFVGQEQTLHFNQLIAVLKLMGYTWANDIYHLSFGMILKDGKKMSTRKGKVVLLEDVLNEAQKKALKNIESRNFDLENKQQVSEQVGVGGVIFHDLKNFRNNNVEFDLNEMLKPEGNTSLYIQYSYARACSILRKSNISSTQINHLDDETWQIVSLLKDFQHYVYTAFDKKDPSIIAKYSLDLAKSFNYFYSKVNILKDETLKNDRLLITLAFSIVIKESLRLLCIEAPEKL